MTEIHRILLLMLSDIVNKILDFTERLLEIQCVTLHM
jgi:hypothetical protein